jgi:hypothetical protein
VLEQPLLAHEIGSALFPVEVVVAVVLAAHAVRVEQVGSPEMSTLQVEDRAVGQRPRPGVALPGEPRPGLPR